MPVALTLAVMAAMRIGPSATTAAGGLVMALLLLMLQRTGCRGGELPGAARPVVCAGAANLALSCAIVAPEM